MNKNKNIKFNKFNKYKYIFNCIITYISYCFHKSYIIYSYIKDNYCIIKSEDIIENNDIENNNEIYEMIR